MATSPEYTIEELALLIKSTGFRIMRADIEVDVARKRAESLRAQQEWARIELAKAQAKETE